MKSGAERELNDSSTASQVVSQSKMTDEVFRNFQRIALETTGIELADTKRSMIVNRFSRRLNVLGLSSFEEYLSLVAQPGHAESSEFIDTVTTNLTYFFREPHHFQVLAEHVLPVLAKRPDSEPVRIWSAGCSSGAEPYTLSIIVSEVAEIQKRSARILCSDIDSKMVKATRQGLYNAEQMRGLDEPLLSRWFKKTPTGLYQADEKLRRMLICKQLNLFDRWPIKPGVDVIMCRNVLIYFNTTYQKKLLQKFGKVQQKGSYLFLGHSETLEGCSDIYRRIDNTVYERI